MRSIPEDLFGLRFLMNPCISEGDVFQIHTGCQQLPRHFQSGQLRYCRERPLGDVMKRLFEEGVSQKAYDRINAKIADISEALANASMKKAAAEEKIIDGTVNSVVVSGDGTWKTRGHTSLIGVCALIGADCGKFSTWKSCPLIAKDVTPIKKIFLRSEQKHGLKYQRYIGDGDSKTFLSIAEKEPYGDSVPIVKIEWWPCLKANG
ncbi:uncharacterized protein TNCV_639351 [Trichonephila clavipes]|nr:uncharacterized protein TNCV_639351 [Trichonephila clavipes]